MSSPPDSQSFGENRFERHPVLTIVILLTFLMIAVDLAVGQVLGVVGYHRLLRGLAIERTYRVANPIYHHDLVPSFATDSALWGSTYYPLRTNSLGFKDATTRRVEQRSNLPRVLLMGDSFTEGIGVPFPETYAGRLAAEARTRGVDVLDGAVASYSPIIYLRKTLDLIDRRGIQIDEVVVFLDISDVQDEANYYVDSAGGIRSQVPVGFIGSAPTLDELYGLPPHAGTMSRVLARVRANRSFAHRLLYELKHGFANPELAPPGCVPPGLDGPLSCRGGWTNSSEIMRLYGNVGLSRASEHLTSLAEALRARGIPLTLVVYPWPQQLRWNDRSSLQVARWRRWAGEKQVSFVEMFSDFFQRVDSTSADETIGSLFIAGDVHPTSAGHLFMERSFVNHYCRQRRAEAAVSPLSAALCTGSLAP